MVVADLIDRIKEENIRKALLNIANWDLSTPSYNEELLKDAIQKMRECMIEEQIRKLKEKMNTVHDGSEKNEIALAIFELRKKQGGSRNG